MSTQAKLKAVEASCTNELLLLNTRQMRTIILKWEKGQIKQNIDTSLQD